MIFKILLMLTFIVLSLIVQYPVFGVPIVGTVEPTDLFGYSVASGDFDKDGFDDLAIGAPFDNIGSIQEAGAVNVIYGSSGSGLTASGNQVWHQDSPGVLGTAEPNDSFGSSVASGDFDKDGFDDLAIGVSSENIGSIQDAGAVNVIYGSSGSGLTASGNQVWHQDSPGVLGTAEPNDSFGSSVASGDFDKDGFDDLAIGAPYDDIGSIQDAGAVNVIYGSSGSGLTASGNQVWHQDSPGVLGTAEPNDSFGSSIASGDFDKDGFDDLAIGVFGENIGNIGAGAVNVIYGSSGSGLTASGNQVWHQDSPGVLGTAEPNDSFGSSVASGDFDKDGFDDLAIGAHGDNIGSIQEAGAVNVIYGSSGSGLTASGNQVWHQDSPGVLGTAERTDSFGRSVASGDFDKDGFDDLAIGAPFDNIGSIQEAGAVNVIYGSSGSGLTASGNQVWHQDSPGVLGTAEPNDLFGYLYSVASGDFDKDGFDDLAIGAPYDDIGSIQDAGAVNVIYGSSGSGLTASGNQVWHQDSDE